MTCQKASCEGLSRWWRSSITSANGPVAFGRDLILERLQGCISGLESDGADAVLLLCTGTFPAFDHDRPLLSAHSLLLGAVAADVLAEAVVRGVEAAETLAGVPAVRDWPAAGRPAVGWATTNKALLSGPARPAGR